MPFNFKRAKLAAMQWVDRHPKTAVGVAFLVVILISVIAGATR